MCPTEGCRDSHSCPNRGKGLGGGNVFYSMDEGSEACAGNHWPKVHQWLQGVRPHGLQWTEDKGRAGTLAWGACSDIPLAWEEFSPRGLRFWGPANSNSWQHEVAEGCRG